MLVINPGWVGAGWRGGWLWIFLSLKKQKKLRIIEKPHVNKMEFLRVSFVFKSKIYLTVWSFKCLESGPSAWGMPRSFSLDLGKWISTAYWPVDLFHVPLCSSDSGEQGNLCLCFWASFSPSKTNILGLSLPEIHFCVSIYPTSSLFLLCSEDVS